MDELERMRFVAHERLKMALRIEGSSLAKIGRSIGVSKTTMSKVGLRKLRVPRAEQAIAEVLGVPVETLFEPDEKQKGEQ